MLKSAGFALSFTIVEVLVYAALVAAHALGLRGFTLQGAVHASLFAALGRILILQVPVQLVVAGILHHVSMQRRFFAVYAAVLASYIVCFIVMWNGPVSDVITKLTVSELSAGDLAVMTVSVASAWFVIRALLPGLMK